MMTRDDGNGKENVTQQLKRLRSCDYFAFTTAELITAN